MPALVDHFVRKFSEKFGRSVNGIRPEAMQLLQRWHWPGNVRELENVVYRSAVAATGDTILPKDLPDEVREPKAAGETESLEILYDRLAKVLRAQHPGEEMTTLNAAMESRLPEGAAKAAPKKKAKK